MRIRNCLILLSLLLSVFTFTVAAQSTDPGRVPTVEEMYLEDADILLIREYILSYDRDVKLGGLNEIGKMIEEGGAKGQEMMVLGILEYAAQEGTGHVIRESGRVINYFPMVRKKAVQLIGLLGSESSDEKVKKSATDILIGILLNDPEVMVKAEAVYALGVIGLNEDGNTVKAIEKAIRIQTRVAPDNNFAYAVVLAIGKIAEKNKGIKEWEGFSALITIMQGNYISKVKTEAYNLLKKLRTDY